MANNDVLKTSDYSIFKTLVGNRDVSEKRVNRIMESISTIGYVSNPIIVNENMEVIDGQGRLEALKRLNHPVEYRIIKGATITQCRIMNSVGEQWKNRNFVKSFADTGAKSYQRLYQLMDMYDADLNIVLRLINRRSHDDSRMIKSGDFFMSNEEFGKGLKKLPIYSAYSKALKRFHGNTQIKKKVIIFLIEHGGYPHQSIIDALVKCSPDEVYATTDEGLIKCIEDVYNKFKREDKKLYFLSDYRRSK